MKKLKLALLLVCFICSLVTFVSLIPSPGRSQQVVIYGPVSSIASGSVAMTTGAITAGTCGTTVTVAAPAVTTTDVIVTAFNAAPNGTQAGLTAWPTAGNVNFAYCGIAETPAAMTINWKVTR